MRRAALLAPLLLGGCGGGKPAAPTPTPAAPAATPQRAGDLAQLERLMERRAAALARGRVGAYAATTLIVMGDARNNYREPGLEAFRSLAERSRRLYWLNPEPRDEWDTTDSIMSVYGPACDRVFEVRTLRQLTACVDEIT